MILALPFFLDFPGFFHLPGESCIAGFCEKYRLVLVTDVERGLACGCICPCCGHRLEAHKGNEKAHYFAHDDGADCASAYQTALHILAKEVLYEHGKLMLPTLSVYPCEELGRRHLRKKVVRHVVPENKFITADRVSLEKKIGDVIPDVIFHVSGKTLLVEIWVTHRVDGEKQQKIEALGIPTVEFDFSRMDRIVTKDDLYRVLVLGEPIVGYGGGQWIYHPKRTETQQEVDAEFLAKKDGLEKEWLQWVERRRQRLLLEQERAKEEERRKEQEDLNRRMIEYGRKADAQLAEKIREEEEKRKKDFLF